MSEYQYQSQSQSQDSNPLSQINLITQSNNSNSSTTPTTTIKKLDFTVIYPQPTGQSNCVNNILNTSNTSYTNNNTFYIILESNNNHSFCPTKINIKNYNTHAISIYVGNKQQLYSIKNNINNINNIQQLQQCIYNNNVQCIRDYTQLLTHNYNTSKVKQFTSFSSYITQQQTAQYNFVLLICHKDLYSLSTNINPYNNNNNATSFGLQWIQIYGIEFNNNNDSIAVNNIVEQSQHDDTRAKWSLNDNLLPSTILQRPKTVLPLHLTQNVSQQQVVG